MFYIIMFYINNNNNLEWSFGCYCVSGFIKKNGSSNKAEFFIC